MLQINTKQVTKLVEVDGFSFNVRRPGAGESLTLQKSGREITSMNKNSKPTPAQQEKLENLTMEVLAICLRLFKGADKPAEQYLQTLDAEVLLQVISEIFDMETKDEPAAIPAAS